MAQCRNFLTKFPGKVNQTLNAEGGMEKSVLWLDAGDNSIGSAIIRSNNKKTDRPYCPSQ
ncbi:hypothetical protein BIY37_04510 [Candidatus Brocadia sapporoensis]|uniref:Uncharacterized protein n=1 Tax=Candidatus Brocadia sapporoensis TaxID=392547 RepID=A0A1V6M1C8_9BACT|nr:hypothetical protein BIY37_04510 [Candidatus Brocadia sapporoensis]GJQ23401.1 MAG: hypothetical protein HBSAPP01_11910 [Candidatus Brocadia sapporoensis]